MDMNSFLQRKVTNATLESMNGRYEGRILRVQAQRVYNQWKLTKEEIVPVISFEDGWEWIPNIGARRELISAWGGETDLWIGRRVAIYLRPVARREKDSGRLVEKAEKCVEPFTDRAVQQTTTIREANREQAGSKPPRAREGPVTEEWGVNRVNRERQEE